MSPLLRSDASALAVNVVMPAVRRQLASRARLTASSKARSVPTGSASQGGNTVSEAVARRASLRRWAECQSAVSAAGCAVTRLAGALLAGMNFSCQSHRKVAAAPRHRF